MFLISVIVIHLIVVNWIHMKIFMIVQEVKTLTIIVVVLHRVVQIVTQPIMTALMVCVYVHQIVLMKGGLVVTGHVMVEITMN